MRITTKAIGLVLMLLLLTVMNSRGQGANTEEYHHLTPLIQIMNADALIDRPEAFRELQAEIDNALGNGNTGLHLEALYNLMSDIRKELMGSLQVVEILPPDSSTKPFLIRIPGSTLSIGLDSTPSTQLTSIRRQILSILEPKIRAVLTQVPNKELRKAFFQALKWESIVIGEQSMEVDRATIETWTSDASSPTLEITISTYLINKLFKLIQGKLIQMLADRGLLLTNSWPAPPNDLPIKQQFAQALNEQIDKARKALNVLLDKGENSVSGVVEKANKILVGANIGLGLTSGNNNAVGGVMITWRPSQSFQVGGYTTGNLGDQTEISGRRWMLGIQARLAPLSNTEALGLISLYPGSNTTSRSAEGGGAIAQRFPGVLGSNGIVVGVSAWYLWNEKSKSESIDIPKSALTAAISFRLLSLGEWGLTLGAVWNDVAGKPRLFFQNSIPLSL